MREEKKSLTYRGLSVYQKAVNITHDVFEITKSFPQEEKKSITKQIRKCSIQVCSKLKEALKERKHGQTFRSKLSEAEDKVCETQMLLEIAKNRCYFEKGVFKKLHDDYDRIVSKIEIMIDEADKWPTLEERVGVSV